MPGLHKMLSLFITTWEDNNFCAEIHRSDNKPVCRIFVRDQKAEIEYLGPIFIKRECNEHEKIEKLVKLCLKVREDQLFF